MWSNLVIKQKIDHVHPNPVEDGRLVYKAEDDVYSSARNYGGEKDLLDGIAVFEFFDFR